MYNLQELVIEKYKKGVIDDEHFLSLYESTENNNSDEKQKLKDIKKRKMQAKLIKAAALAAGVAAVTAITLAIKQVIKKSKSELDTHSDNLQAATVYAVNKPLPLFKSDNTYVKEFNTKETLNKLGEQYASEISKLYDKINFNNPNSVNEFKKSCDDIYNKIFKDFIVKKMVDKNGVSRNVVLARNDLYKLSK